MKDASPSSIGLDEQKSDRRNGNFNSPPSYFGQSEALIYQMKRLETKIEQLDSLHKKHLDRPTLDDKNEEETQIKSLTKDICDVSVVYQTYCGIHSLKRSKFFVEKKMAAI